MTNYCDVSGSQWMAPSLVGREAHVVGAGSTELAVGTVALTMVR